MNPSASENVNWIKQWARLTPHSVAFKDGDDGRQYTYSEAFHLAEKVSHELVRRFALIRGDRIAVLATNELETIILFFASLRIGCVFVPIGFRLTAPEISHILNDCEASLLISQNEFSSSVSSVLANLSPALTKHTMSFEDFQKFVDLELSTLRRTSGRTRHDRDANENFEYDYAIDDPCMILYTSGTTGAPKGAMISLKMLHWNSLNTTLRLNLAQSDVFISFLPFFHTAGWNVLLTPFVHRGAKIVLTKKFDSDRVLSLSSSEGATILFGVPTTLEMMSRSSHFRTTDLSRIRYAIVGGEPMSIELIHTWQNRGISVRQGYGLTEFGPNVFSLNEEDSIRKIGSIGFPNFYVQTRIINENDQDVPVGEVGELLLRGPVCTPGYWRNPKATLEAFCNGWFRTGDLVRCDDEGYFFVAGRKKDMFISGGENVYPVEVERVISQHPAIREVAVIGVPDPKWGEVGRAYVSLNQDQNVSAEALRHFCQDKLARFKVPKQILFLESLPKGDSGKVLKRLLREIS